MASHAISLCDMHAKYADVMRVGAVLASFNTIPAGQFDLPGDRGRHPASRLPAEWAAPGGHPGAAKKSPRGERGLAARHQWLNALAECVHPKNEVVERQHHPGDAFHCGQFIQHLRYCGVGTHHQPQSKFTAEAGLLMLAAVPVRSALSSAIACAPIQLSASRSLPAL